MSFDRDDKVDIIDLLINLLRDHEKKLDEISYRLEKLVEGRQPLDSLEPLELQPARPPQMTTASGIVAQMSNWQDFRERGSRSQLVSVNITETQFKVSAYTAGILYSYAEKLPSIQIKRTDDGGNQMNLADIADAQVALSGKLLCGIALETRSFESKVEDESIRVVSFSVNRAAAKDWIASQLDVDASMVIEGELDIPRS